MNILMIWVIIERWDACVSPPQSYKTDHPFSNSLSLNKCYPLLHFLSFQTKCQNSKPYLFLFSRLLIWSPKIHNCLNLYMKDQTSQFNFQKIMLVSIWSPIFSMKIFRFRLYLFALDENLNLIHSDH